MNDAPLSYSDKVLSYNYKQFKGGTPLLAKIGSYSSNLWHQ